MSYPKKEGYESKEIFKVAVIGSGRSRMVCNGGSSDDVEVFLKGPHNQIRVSGASGNTTDKYILPNSLKEAIRMSNAIYAITVDGTTVNEFMKIYTKI